MVWRRLVGAGAACALLSAALLGCSPAVPDAGEAAKALVTGLNDADLAGVAWAEPGPPVPTPPSRRPWRPSATP